MYVKRVLLSASLAVLLAGSSFIVSCEKASPPTPTPTPTPAPTAPSPVAWGPCPEPADPDDDVVPGLQCGEVSVPMDYGKPDGATATIAVIRLPATGAKIGSLVINPGGPGASGVEFMPSLVKWVPPKILERFDLVGFDPRGVGKSRPGIDCNSDAEDDRDRADADVDYSPAGVAQTETETKEYIQRCVDRSGPVLLANVGTEAVARDLDLLRAALGDDALTYLGFSYGTYIGSRYAELFPDRVRAMVLDGAIDPTVDPLRAQIEQAASFQKAFDVFAAACATKADCPLGADPTRATATLHSLIDPLVDRPATTKDPRGLSYQDAMTAVLDALYSPGSWAQLTAGLSALRDRTPADDLLELADEYLVRDANGHYDNSSDAYYAVMCVDASYPTDPAAWIDFDRQYRTVSPFFSYGTFTGYAPRPVCAQWPVPAEGAVHAVSAPGLPRTLVVSTTGDPATPYLDGVHLAEQMNAALLTVEGTQHTAAFYDIPCVDDAIVAYLVDLALPPPDAKCGA